MLKTTNSSSSDSFYKKQIEQLTKEKKQLKERLELLESENHDLRRSVFELSVSKASKEEVFDLDVALIPTNEDNNEYRTSTNTSFEGYLHNMEWDWKDPSKGESGSFSRFGWKFDLAGHLGAVYVVEFSKCGRLIGSGSQDKSLRIWQLDKPTEPALLLMDAHTSSISDLCWNSDSTNLATCGYDRQVKEWSLEEGATIKWLASYSLSGLVQNVEFCKGQPQLLVASTSQGNIHMLDRRTQKSTNVITNDCSVNSIYVHYDGILVTSGDHRGYIKRWDMRYFSKPLEVFYNSKRPISHLEVSRPREEEEGQYLAVNAFDNTIRVYDRGGYLLGSSCTDSLKLLHTLKGIKSQNWPIRCSFYQGADFLRFIKSGLSSKDRLDTREGNPLSGISFSNSVANQTSNIHSLVPLSNYRPQETLTLASGSADGNIYIYDVGQPEGTACLVQCCHGHSDRVYGVCFHPTEPIFASCSADYLIKIWVPVKSKSHAI